MAMNDNAVITAARGWIYTAPVGTASPSVADVADFDPAVGFAGWETIGHTSLDELPEFGFDGGETETRGTWQNATFRQVITEVASDYVTMNVHQFDENVLGLYYGTSNGGAEAGRFSVQNAPTATVDRALFIVIVDGDIKVGFWATKAAFGREDAISLDTDSFAFFPLRATFLKYETSPMYDWIGPEIGVIGS